MTKKMIGILLSFLILFSLSGCGNSAQNSGTNTDGTFSATQQEESSPAGQSDTADEENSSQTSDRAETEQEENMDHTILVAYFSATGTTEQVAQQAAEILGANLYEIVPEDPYTEEDLAYYTGGRADQEQDDPDVRPAISGSVEDMDQYDTVLLGYPIWHGQAPRIISTFLESYDFSGKTILPFCTSHSSSIGSSDDNLHGLCPDTVNWLEGQRFGNATSEDEIRQWIESML